MKKTVMIIMVTLFLIGGFGLYVLFDEEKTEVFTQVGNQEMMNMLAKKQHGLIYVGRPTCEDCVAFVPVLEKALQVMDTQALYFNTDANRMNDQFDQVVDALDIEVVPTVVFIQDGQVAGKLQGNADEEMTMSWLESVLK